MPDLPSRNNTFDYAEPQVSSTFSTMTHHRLSIPVPRKTLVGRGNELALAREALLDQGVPWLTMTGPGGVGKTHLAQVITSKIADAYEDGVVLVPLADLRDPDLVLPSIAAAVEMPEPKHGKIERQLAAYLQSMQLLICLDNCEHLPDAFPPIARMLGSCPRVQILATSRIRLNLSGEHILPLNPLGLPDPDRGISEFGNADAIALFVMHARASKPGFTLTESNAKAVREICARLDGLPLALELAAPHIRTIAPEQLLELLAHRLSVLVGGLRDAPPRQRALRDTIAWSYGLLTPEQQKLFRHFGVFAGGFDLAAASAISGGDSFAMLGQVGALVDHGLIVPIDTSDDHRRFRSLETIREYAIEQLAISGEEIAARDAHAAYYVQFAHNGAAELIGPNQAAWLDRLDAEIHNFRTAFEWLMGPSRTSTTRATMALGLATDLWRFWVARGRLREGRSWLNRALDRPESASIDLASRAKATQYLGNMALDQGDLVEAQRRYERSLELCSEADDRTGIASANNGLGLVAYYHADYAESRLRHETALKLRRTLDDRHGLGNSIHNLGVTANAEGRFTDAQSLIEEGLRIRRDNQDDAAVGFSLFALGDLRFNQGKLDEAEMLHHRSLTLFEQIGDQLGIAYARSGLGYVSHEKRDETTALTYFLGALRLRRDLGDRRGAVECLEGLATVATAFGRPAQAATLFAASAQARQEMGIPLRPVDQERHAGALAAVKAKLSKSAFDTAAMEGTSAGIDAIVTMVLDPAWRADAATIKAKIVTTDETSDAEADSVRAGAEAITPRELAVLQLLVRDLTNAEIADELYISVRTVESHVANILSKLGVTSRAKAKTVALRFKLVEPGEPRTR
jgi:predicted ATPase/DNA-binding CsgD family transcriptional regulator